MTASAEFHSLYVREVAYYSWHTVAEHSRFTDLTDLTDLKRSFDTADYVPPYTVFEFAGNNVRVVVLVRYRDGKMFVRWVMTHREYDDCCMLYRKGKV
jgi:mRNA interferase HigB